MTNTGTLITAAIRPNDSQDLIASAFANEIKGGLHSASSSADRDSIIEARREWGMLCYVSDEDTTYQLSYNYSSNNILDPLNWVFFSGGLSSSAPNVEWINSVISIESTPPIASTGDRYLVADVAFGAFNGNEDRVAIYDESINGGSGGWNYITPTNGTTLRVDQVTNAIWKYNGSKWVIEYQNQVRFIQPTSVGGLTYSYTTIGQELMGTYSNVIIYANFGMTNSGPILLDIDGVGYKSVKKAISNTVVDLDAGDFSPGVEYQLVYQDGVFQTTINSSSNAIGPAEDGDYSDGLFTDFTPSTLIGTPIDRFNEILLALVPPSAPDMMSWGASGSFVSGKLSFDENTPSFIGATNSITGYVGIGGTFSSSGYRLGITSRYTQPVTSNTYYVDITGVLNSDVNGHMSLPNPSYVTASFGNSIYGTISLFLNDVSISSVSLSSTYSVIDSTNGGATSGIYLSSATSSKYPTGYPFYQYWNRTGTYRIKPDNSGIVSGYNKILLIHEFGSTTRTLNKYEWVCDFDNTQTSFSSVSTQISQVAANKYLSGIKWNDVVRIKYKAVVNNCYRNTYSLDPNAVVVNDVSLITSNGVYTGPGGSGVNTNGPLPILLPSPSSRSLTVPASPSSTFDFTSGWTFSEKSNTRRVNNQLTFNTSVLRTIQGQVTGATYTDSNWFIDTYGTSSTNTVDNFDDEEKRILNGSTKYGTYTTKTTTISPINKWDSTKSIRSFAGYQNALQVINGNLIYPRFNFGNPGPGDSDRNPNYGLGAQYDYTACNTTVVNGFGSNNRTYTRYFDLSSYAQSNYSRLTFNIDYTGCTFVPMSTPLTNNTNVWVEFKLPYHSGTAPEPLTTEGSQTGWMDASKIFISGQYEDGDGCLSGSVPTTSGSDWLINFGFTGTQWSGKVILFRITAGPNWTGYIDKIQVTPY